MCILHRWGNWKPYAEHRSGLLRQVRMCVKCKLIEDRLPADALGNIGALFPRIERKELPRATA